MGLLSNLRKPAWERARKKAERAEKAGDWAAAQGLYAQAAEDAPDEDRADLAEKRDACAARLYQYHVEAAQEAAERGQAEQAMERWELALRFAISDDQRRETESALRDLEQRLLHWQAESERGKPRDAGDAGDAADEDLFQMLIGGMDPERADAYEALDEVVRQAVVALQEGRPEEALEPLTEAVASSPNAIVLFELGSCMRALDRNEEAIASLLEAERLDPEWAAVKLTLARIHWSESRWAEAEAVLQRAVDLDVDDTEVFEAVARHALLTETPDFGLDAAEVGLELEPTHRELTLLKGRLLEKMGRLDEAVDAYETLVERYWRYDHDNDQLQFDREAGLLAARLYARQRLRPERAEELMRAVIHVTPVLARWQFEVQLAEILLAADRRDEAHEQLRETARRVPDEERLWRARVAELQGDDAAVERLVAELDAEQRALWEAREHPA